MKALRSDKAVVLLFKGLIVFVIWGAIAFGIWRYLGDEWQGGGDVTAFDPEIGLYTAQYPFIDPPLENGAHIRGKAVVVDVTDGDVLPLTFELPSDIAAHAPGEVGTVIQVERLLEEAGSYGDGSPAYRQNALVRLVDLGFECVIGEAFITGGEPPGEKDGEGPGFGDEPDGQIPELVARLPRYTLDGESVTVADSEGTARGGRPAGYTESAFVASPYNRGSDAMSASFSARADIPDAQASGTAEMAAKLSQGMTVDDVIGRFGPPISRSRMGSGTRRTTRCTWQLSDGHSLTCRFRANSLQKWEVQ